MAELAHKPTLSTASRSLLSAYRVDEQPDPDVARRSWQALAERVHHPQANAREAWVAQLPVVDEPYGQDDLFADFEDDISSDLSSDPSSDEEDDWSGTVATPRVDAWYYAKSVATSVAIAAAVLLGMRVVVTSATTLTQQARGEALEAPYQGDANRKSGRAVEGEPTPDETATKARGSRKAPATTEEVALLPPPAQPEAAPPVVTPATPAAVTKSAKPRAKAKAATQVDDVQDELAIVRNATAAKNAGKLDEAIELLGEHGKQFPGGVLAQEREVLRAEVLCARGDKTQARTLVERFVSRHPTSALLGRINGVCAD